MLDDLNLSVVIWIDWQEFCVGDYEVWGYCFKFVLCSDDFKVQVLVRKFIVKIDMLDCVDGVGDVICFVQGIYVIFDLFFKECFVIIIIGQELFDIY